MNFRVPDKAIYLHTYLRAAFHRAAAYINSFGTGPQTRIAATRLAWTAVILNSCETTSGPLSNGRALKMYN